MYCFPFRLTLLTYLNFFCPVSINDKQWPKRSYPMQKYFWFYSNCDLSVCVVRKQVFAAPGLCFATRNVVCLCSPDKDRLGRKTRQKKKYLWSPERSQVCSLLKGG